MTPVDLREKESLTEAFPLYRIFSGYRTAPAFVLLLACAITLPCSLAIAVEPSRLDGAIFLYVGEMWTRGIVPYLQLFDNKPPGIFAVTAIASSTHHALWTLAFIAFLFVMGCIVAVRKTLEIAGAPWQAVFFGTIATALMVNLRFYGVWSAPETYMLAPMAASMTAFVYAIKSGKLRYVFLAGVCSGLACMFKPFALSVFMAQVAFVVLFRRSRLRAVLGSILANTAGAIAAWIPVSAYFALHGALKRMLDASFFYNLHYGIAAQPKLLELLSRLAASLLPLSTMIGCIFIGLAMLPKAPRKWRASSALCGN